MLRQDRHYSKTVGEEVLNDSSKERRDAEEAGKREKAKDFDYTLQ